MSRYRQAGKAKIDPMLLMSESHPIEDVEALLNCLTHLEREARESGLPFVADLIGQAAHVVADSGRLAENALVAHDPGQSEGQLGPKRH